MVEERINQMNSGRAVTVGENHCVVRPRVLACSCFVQVAPRLWTKARAPLFVETQTPRQRMQTVAQMYAGPGLRTNKHSKHGESCPKTRFNLDEHCHIVASERLLLPDLQNC